jgi:hypothetical protein
MTDFHKTGAGQLFYGKHVPELVKELRRIADNLEKGNKLYEREMKLDKKKNALEEKLEDVKETEKIDKTNLAVNDNVHIKKDPELEGLDD